MTYRLKILDVFAHLLLIVGLVLLCLGVSLLAPRFGSTECGVCCLVGGGVLVVCFFLVKQGWWFRMLSKKRQDELNSRTACLPPDEYWIGGGRNKFTPE